MAPPTHVPRPVVGDYRDPSAGAMRAVPVKLPLDVVEQLQAQADRLHCFPSSLARTLIVQGLDQLAAATTTARGVA